MKRGSAFTEALVGTSAVVVLGVVLGRWAGRPVSGESLGPAEPIAEWEELRSGPNRLGSADARLTLATFSDFQCPWCAEFALAFREASARDPGALALVFRHYPLREIHPFADSAAIAAECAGEQGRFASYHDALFAAQDRIGIMPWDSIAASVGVADLPGFRACISEARPAQRIARDVALGDRLEVPGTPTVYADGVPLPGPWSADQLLELASERKR